MDLCCYYLYVPLSQSSLSVQAAIHLLPNSNIEIDFTAWSLAILIYLLSGLSWLKCGSELIYLYESLEWLTNNFILKPKLFKVIYKALNKTSILMGFSCISYHCLKISLANHSHYLKIPRTFTQTYVCTCYFLCLKTQYSPLCLENSHFHGLQRPFLEKLMSLGEKSCPFLCPTTLAIH